MNLEIFSIEICEKHSNAAFHGHPSIVSRVVLYGLPDGQTDMTKLIVAPRNFANASKNPSSYTPSPISTEKLHLFNSDSADC